jgi:hypothetical protein
MSLVSAGTIVGGTKEYLYRGVQQLPIVLSATSLLFTITTGSIAHLNLSIGMVALMPIYTYLLQMTFDFINSKIGTNLFTGPVWTRDKWIMSTSDVCKIVPPEGPQLKFYNAQDSTAKSVPSYWLTSIAFFFGYCISNAVDIYKTPAENDSDPKNKERRTYQSIFLITAMVLLLCLVLGIRFRYMSGCEGRGSIGLFDSLLAATGAAGIGYGMYDFSRKCGARTSDLFGVLSQILPVSATSSNPTVCLSS